MKLARAWLLALCGAAQASCSPDLPTRWLVEQTAAAHGLPPSLLTALVIQESGFCSDAVSGAGAIGYGQLMPATARGLGVDPHDPAQNLRGAATYLRQQWDTFGDWRLALAAYNAGPGAVTRSGGIPPFPETRQYVQKVLGMYAQLIAAAALPAQAAPRPATPATVRPAPLTATVHGRVVGDVLRNPPLLPLLGVSINERADACFGLAIEVHGKGRYLVHEDLNRVTEALLGGEPREGVRVGCWDDPLPGRLPGGCRAADPSAGRDRVAVAAAASDPGPQDVAPSRSITEDAAMTRTADHHPAPADGQADARARGAGGAFPCCLPGTRLVPGAELPPTLRGIPEALLTAGDQSFRPQVRGVHGKRPTRRGREEPCSAGTVVRLTPIKRIRSTPPTRCAFRRLVGKDVARVAAGACLKRPPTSVPPRDTRHHRCTSCRA